MGRKAYTTAVRLLRDVTKLDFFGWVDDDWNVDAVVYVPYKDFEKCASLMLLPENIRRRMSIQVTPHFLRFSLPKLNSKPVSQLLSEFAHTVSIDKKKKIN